MDREDSVEHYIAMWEKRKNRYYVSSQHRVFDILFVLLICFVYLPCTQQILFIYIGEK